MRQLVLGYSPFDALQSNPIHPFDEVFDMGANLMFRDSLAGCDAVVLWGGADISPALYNEKPINGSGPEQPTQRDLFEWEILREATQRGLPIIGVCRGAQLICAFSGGILAQNVSGHMCNHNVMTYGDGVFSVSSSHHQMMVPNEDSEYDVLAWPVVNISTIYEGISEYESKLYLENKEPECEVVFFKQINAMAIQCHPEWHKAGDPFNMWIMNEILDRQFTGVSV